MPTRIATQDPQTTIEYQYNEDDASDTSIDGINSRGIMERGNVMDDYGYKVVWEMEDDIGTALSLEDDYRGVEITIYTLDSHTGEEVSYAVHLSDKDAVELAEQLIERCKK